MWGHGNMVKDKRRLNTAEYNAEPFYRSATGQVARQLIMRKLAPLISSDSDNIAAAGIGFTAPYLGKASGIVQLQSVGHTPPPPQPRQQCAIIDPIKLPLLDASLDLCLMVHGLEASSSPSATLDETWRVLKGQGKLVLVVPHRANIWSMKEVTPFGFGQPYSVNQIKKLLKQHDFEVGKIRQSLAAPPSFSGLYPKYAPLAERLPTFFGGVLIVEAHKMIYSVRGVHASPPRPRAGVVVQPNSI